MDIQARCGIPEPPLTKLSPGTSVTLFSLNNVRQIGRTHRSPNLKSHSTSPPFLHPLTPFTSSSVMLSYRKGSRRKEQVSGWGRKRCSLTRPQSYMNMTHPVGCWEGWQCRGCFLWSQKPNWTGSSVLDLPATMKVKRLNESKRQ